MKIATIIITTYLAVVLFFADVVATVAALLALILIVALQFMLSLDRPYFDSEDIGREVKPYAKRIGMTEILIVVICAALLFTCYLILP